MVWIITNDAFVFHFFDRGRFAYNHKTNNYANGKESRSSYMAGGNYFLFLLHDTPFLEWSEMKSALNNRTS